MSGKTAIEWADRVWNPVTGCTKVSEGCRNCYAERMAKRFWRGREFGDVQCHEERLDDPCHWKNSVRVFVNSMSDLFHENVSNLFINRIIYFMEVAARQHTYLILTKRPDRMNNYFRGVAPANNVWLGVSIEDQETADERIPLLLKTPAAVRFVSVEPMLGPVNLNRIKWAKIPIDPDNYKRFGVPAPDELWSMNDVLSSRPGDKWNKPKVGLDWVICGGESGPGARPMHPDWVRSLRDQCVDAGVPFFFKQWGEWIRPDQLPRDTDMDRPLPGEKIVNNFTEHSDKAIPPEGFEDFWRYGKKINGRELDWEEWNEFPEART